MPADFLNRRFNFQYREKIFNKLLVDPRSVIDSDPPVVYDRKAENGDEFDINFIRSPTAILKSEKTDASVSIAYMSRR
jgi:hypothetical protein